MKLLITLTLLLGLVTPALAQEPVNEYHSPLRATWRDEVRKDPGLKADIEGALREAVHRNETATFTRNNKHVVIAYAAIWVLTIGFVVLLFLRQGKLKAEIERLHRELGKAIKEEK
jgi:CcmD family protein